MGLMKEASVEFSNVLERSALNISLPQSAKFK